MLFLLLLSLLSCSRKSSALYGWTLSVVRQRLPHFACCILVYCTFFLALYFTCTLPFVYDLSHSEDFDSSFCATWLALTHGFWLPLFQLLKTVIHRDLKACWSPGGTSSEASHWMSMHPPQYCKYFPLSCPRALLALVFKLSTYLKRIRRLYVQDKKFAMCQFYYWA